MIDQAVMAAILESIKDPLLFVDVGHIICYMNRAAIEHFDDGEALLGRSVMDCHNERSCETIRQTLTALEAGEDERLIATTETNRIYMRAVRSPDGDVIGYYERYEPIGG
jgi:PAS domain-containing protein